jgi:hypothetical protein
MREARARPRGNHRIDASNLEYDEVKQQMGRVDFTTLGYEHLRQYIIDKGERVPRGYLFRWGENASDEVLAQAAADLLEETEPGRQLSYLRIFNDRKFPLDHRKLLELGQGSDEDVVFWALRVLKQIAHPSVRALSLRLLEARKSLAGAVGLLLSNYQDGDYALVEAAIRAEQDENQLYRLGYDMRQVVEEHPAPDAAGALLQLYEKEPIGYGRGKTVHLMIWLDVLPEWVREECRHDANFDIRALVEQEE